MGSQGEVGALEYTTIWQAACRYNKRVSATTICTAEHQWRLAACAVRHLYGRAAGARSSHIAKGFGSAVFVGLTYEIKPPIPASINIKVGGSLREMYCILRALGGQIK